MAAVMSACANQCCLQILKHCGVLYGFAHHYSAYTPFQDCIARLTWVRSSCQHAPACAAGST